MQLESYKKILSENFRRIRESKGISSSAIAEILGVSQAKISYIENQKGILSAADIAILSRNLNIPITEFFRGLETKEQSDIAELVSHLASYGAVLLSKPKGLALKSVPFEDVLARSLGYLDDARLHQAFCAAFIAQAATREINVSRIFALIGGNLFLVSRLSEEAKIACKILGELSYRANVHSPRAIKQIKAIQELSEEILKLENWKTIRLPHQSSDEDFPELVKFVSECLDAGK